MKYSDIQVGRFLGWEVYHKGQGLELYTLEDRGAIDGPDLYEVDFTRGHTDGVGQIAIHAFPFENLKIEAGAVYGNELNTNNLGARSVIDYSIWKLQFVAGAEYLKQEPQTDISSFETKMWGYGGRIQINTRNLTAGFNMTHAETDKTTVDGRHDTLESYKVDCLGGFINIDFWKNSIGMGYNYTSREAERGDKFTHVQPFVSYLYKLPADGLSAKIVFATAEAEIEDLQVGDKWKNDMRSVRIRISYDFL